MGGWGASLEVKMCGAMTASMLPEILQIGAEGEPGPAECRERGRNKPAKGSRLEAELACVS